MPEPKFHESHRPLPIDPVGDPALMCVACLACACCEPDRAAASCDPESAVESIEGFTTSE